MDTGDDERMCNIVVEALLELGKPATVSDMASHLKVNEERVQRALITLKETGLIAQRVDRWLLDGWPEDFDEDENLKFSAQEKEIDSMGMRSRQPERGTYQNVSSLAREFGGLGMRSPERSNGLAGLRMRSRSPERGASCPDKLASSPEEKLHARPVGQKDSSHAVVPVMDKRVLSSSPNVRTVGSSNLEIETRKPLQCVLVSDPGIQENIDKISSIIKCLENESRGLEAKDISRKCNIGDAKRFVNPLLYHLEKKQVLISEQVPGTQKKIWKLGPKKPSDQQLIEYAAEKTNTTRMGTVGGSVTTKASPELHLHNHYHQHTHKNYIQIGEVNTMTVPQDFEEHKRVFEKKAEDGV